MEKKIKSDANQREIVILTTKIVQILESIISQRWFIFLIEDTILKEEKLVEIINLLKEVNSYSFDIESTKAALEKLDETIYNINRFLMPVLREKLGISHLSSNQPNRKSDQYIRNSFVAYVFPYNITMVGKLVEQVKVHMN